MKNDLAYAPYGEQYATAGAAPLGLGNVSFAGNSEDTATNLYDAQHREYEPYGRWPSPDPAGMAAANPANPQSWNRYAYALNNPLIATDPSGLGPYIPSAPEPNDPLGDYPACYMDGIPIGCGQAEMEVGIGAAMVCPDSSCGGVGSPFECDAIGICGYGTIDDNPAPPNLTKEQIAACEQTILDAVNAQFGTSLATSDITGDFTNGAVNIDITATSNDGLTPDQFNAIQTGRYTNALGYLTGLGPSLHVAGPSPFDSNGAQFSNSNVGGFLSVSFTAHIDSAFAYNPIGLLVHTFVDVLGSSTRNPCP